MSFLCLDSEKIVTVSRENRIGLSILLFSFTNFRKFDSTVVSIFLFLPFLDGLWKLLAFVDAILIGSNFLFPSMRFKFFTCNRAKLWRSWQSLCVIALNYESFGFLKFGKLLMLVCLIVY